MRLSMLALAASLALGSLAHAADITATPETFPKVFPTVTGGDTLTLTGKFPLLSVSKRAFSPPLIVRAEGAQIGWAVLQDVSGILWTGGAFDPAGTGRMALTLYHGKDVLFENLSFSGSGGTLSGAILRDSEDVGLINSVFDRPFVGASLLNVVRGRLDGNIIVGWAADCLSVGGSSFSSISYNVCVAPKPAPGAGPDGIHVDGIQGYASLPVANHDLIVAYNRIQGEATQGIFFNVIKPNPGPYNIRLIGNVVLTRTAPNGVALDGPGEVRGNRAATMAGSRWQTMVKVIQPGTLKCDNVTEAYKPPNAPNAGWPAVIDPPCSAAPTAAEVAEIAALKAQLVAAEARVTKLQADLAAARAGAAADTEAARLATATLQAALDSAHADTARLRGVLAQIEAMAAV